MSTGPSMSAFAKRCPLDKSCFPAFEGSGGNFSFDKTQRRCGIRADGFQRDQLDRYACQFASLSWVDLDVAAGAFAAINLRPVGNQFPIQWRQQFLVGQIGPGRRDQGFQRFFQINQMIDPYRRGITGRQNRLDDRDLAKNAKHLAYVAPNCAGTRIGDNAIVLNDI